MSVYCPYCMSSKVPDGERCPVCGKDPASYQPSSHHFPPGVMLHERYLLGRVLGEGGFGITYLGFDTILEKRVAIKEYFPTALVKRVVSVTLDVTCYTSSNQEYYEKGRDQFLKEAKTLVKLEEIPNIVRALDYFAEHNTAYIVMEYLEGESLKTLTQTQGPIPPKALFGMLEPVVKAMGDMHKAGIIHRDVSPDNLIRLKNGTVKLIDFGCARTIGGKTMTVTLKEGFAPNEQYTGCNQGPWSDLYSFCATLYYCLTGTVPPDGLSRSAGEDPLVPPTKLGAALTPGEEQTLLKGLAVRPADRFSSMEELYQALYEGTGPIPDKKPDPPVLDPPFPDPKRKKMAVIASVCAAAAVLAIAGKLILFPGTAGDRAAEAEKPAETVTILPKENAAGEENDGENLNGNSVIQLNPKGEQEPEVDGESEEAEEETEASKEQADESAAETETGEAETEAPAEPETEAPETAAPETAPPATAAPTTAPPPTEAAPSKDEFEAQIETAMENGQFDEAENLYRQMHSLGYISGEKLGNSLAEVIDERIETVDSSDGAPPAEVFQEAESSYRQLHSQGYITNSRLMSGLYGVAMNSETCWQMVDYGNNSSPYITLAVRLYQEVGNSGYASGAYAMGYAYKYGFGVAQDQTAAFEWFLKATNLGDSYSCYMVALCYARGEGVAQDTGQAIEWCNKSQEYGIFYPEAQELLEELQNQ